MKNSNQKMKKGENPEYADFRTRFSAYFVDQVIVLTAPVAILGIIYFLNFDFEIGQGSFILIVCVLILFLEWIYFIVMTYKYQVTLGKKLLGLRVVADEKKELSLRRVLLREIVGRIFSFFAQWIEAAFPFFLTNVGIKKQTRYDIIAGTIVVKEKEVSTGVIAGIAGASCIVVMVQLIFIVWFSLNLV